VEDRLKIFKSMDEQAGFGAEYKAQPPALDMRAGRAAPPTVMWRKL
jgi:hypothetical protein